VTGKSVLIVSPRDRHAARQAGPKDLLEQGASDMIAPRPTTVFLALSALMIVASVERALGEECDACATPAAACEAPGECENCAAEPVCDSLITDACDSEACCGEGCGVATLFKATPCCVWNLDAGVMFLDRSDAPNVPIIRDQSTGAVLFNTEDLDYGWGAFPYGRLTQMCCCQGWDIGYFGGEPWQDDQTVGEGVSPVYTGSGLIVGSTAPGALFNVSAGTELHTADINYRRVVGWHSTFVAGFRWMELSDSIDISRTQGGVVEQIQHTDTNNHLYGVQVGLDTILYQSTGRLSLVSNVRVGALANHADQTSSSEFVSGVPGFVDYLYADDDDSSFFGALGLQGWYQLNNRWSIVGGYQLFWIEQVALAPAQIPINNFQAPGTADIDTSDGLFLHGALVGLSYQF
jgi:hypothetical protein